MNTVLHNASLVCVTLIEVSDVSLGLVPLEALLVVTPLEFSAPVFSLGETLPLVVLNPVLVSVGLLGMVAPLASGAVQGTSAVIVITSEFPDT